MTDLVDLGPAGELLRAVAATVGDDQLDDPTPCEGRTVGQLAQHLVGLTQAFEQLLARSGRDPQWNRTAD